MNQSLFSFSREKGCKEIIDLVKESYHDLYKIKDKEANVVDFETNWAQKNITEPS